MAYETDEPKVETPETPAEDEGTSESTAEETATEGEGEQSASAEEAPQE